MIIGKKVKIPVKIAILVGSFQGGGIERAVLTFLRELDKSRFQAHIICFSTEGILRDQFIELGFPITVYRRRFWNAAILAYRLAIYCLYNRISIIHSHAYHADVVARLAGYLADLRVINTIHTNSTWKRNPCGFKQHLRRLSDRLTARFWGDAFIALSESIWKFHIRELGYPAKGWRIIPNPIDIQRLPLQNQSREEIRSELGLGERDIMILSVGNLLPVKGHRLLLEAFSRLSPTTKNCSKIFVAGEGSERQYLTQRADQLGLAQRFRLLGYRQDIGRLLSAADIFVMPSLSEGQSLAILEAMAMQCPIIVTSTGGHMDFLSEENAVVIPPNDIDSLTEAAANLIESPGTRRILGIAAQRTFERLQFFRSTQLQMAFYDELLQGRSA